MTLNSRKPSALIFKNLKQVLLKVLKIVLIVGALKRGTSKTSLVELKTTIIKQTGNKIVELKIKSPLHKAGTSLLRNHEIRKILVDFHQNYIVVPIDKASGNVSIICKRFYPLTLIKELGVTRGNSISNKTYETINTTNENNIITSYLLVTKNPTKTRFIIPAPKLFLKPLSKSITAVSKTLS